MLSRIAENFYWIGRYVERMNHTICLLNVMTLSDGKTTNASGNAWDSLIAVNQGAEFFRKFHAKANEKTVHEFLIFSHDNPSSVFSCIKTVRENMRSVRNRVSKALWLITNEFYLVLRKKKPDQILSYRRGPFYRLVRDFCITFQGAADSTLMHEETWQFLRLGRALERAIETARILDLKEPVDIHQWHTLLQSVDAMEAYYNTYLNRIEPPKAVELLLLHRNFPRSIRFAVQEIDGALKNLPHHPDSVSHWQLKLKIRGLLTEFLTITAKDIFRSGLHNYLTLILKRLMSVDMLLSKAFFGFIVESIQTDAKTEKRSHYVHLRSVES